LSAAEQAVLTPTITSSLTGDDFYWYVDKDGNTWQVEAANNGTGLKFTRIESSADNTEVRGDVEYVAPDPADPDVDAPYADLFTWGGVVRDATGAITGGNPATVGSFVDGRIDGTDATAAEIKIDYAGSSANYGHTITLGGGIASITVAQDEGDVSIARKVFNAINATEGWEATLDRGDTGQNTLVTITRKELGPIAAAEWAKFDTANDWGSYDGANQQQGVLGYTIDSGLNGTAALVAIRAFGLPVLVAGNATTAQIASAIRDALNNVYGTDNWPAELADWAGAPVGISGAGNNVLEFKQTAGNESVIPVTAFPDASTIVPFSGTLPNPLKTSFIPHTTYTEPGTGDVFTLTLGTAPAERVAVPEGGYITYFGKVVYIPQIPGGATATDVATAIRSALNDGSGHVSLANKSWTIGGTNNQIILTENGTNNASAGDQGVQLIAFAENPTPLSGAALNGGYTGGAAALAQDVAALTDDSATPPAWLTGLEPGNAANGINASGVYGTGTNFSATNGTPKVGEQIGTNEQVREAWGDGDYLDFSAFDVVRVTQGGTVIAGDDNINGNVVNITGTDGVYTFTLLEGSASTLIGVVDFGTAVNFTETNFILDNDILVV
jgi:hypothetical protein